MTSPFIALRSYMAIRISQWLQGFVGSCTVLLVVLFSSALRWDCDGSVIVNYSKADIQNSIIYSRFRHKAVIERSKVATSYRHAWALKFDWIDWRGAPILRVPAEFS